jgi:hypothetical protein
LEAAKHDRDCILPTSWPRSTTVERVDRRYRFVAKEIVAAVLDAVGRHSIKSAHYVGMADEGLIRALKTELGPGLTIMDYFDRWGGGARFFGDDEGLSLPACADWLEGVTSYHEGCPEADLLVFDLTGEDAEFLLRELLEPREHRKPFKRVILAKGSLPWPPPSSWYRWDLTHSFWTGVAVEPKGATGEGVN